MISYSTLAMTRTFNPDERGVVHSATMSTVQYWCWFVVVWKSDICDRWIDHTWPLSYPVAIGGSGIISSSSCCVVKVMGWAKSVDTRNKVEQID